MLLNPYILGASSPPPPPVERTPDQLVFAPFLSQLLFDPQPLRAEMTDFVDNFPLLTNLDVTGTKFGGTVGTATVAGGVLTIAAGQGTAVMEKTSVSSYGVPDVFVELDVSQQGTSGTLDIVEVGVFKDGSNFIVAGVDRVSNLAWIQSTTTSSNVRIGQVSFTVPTGAFKLGFGMVGNKAEVYVNSGAGWTRITGGDLGSATFTTVASLSGWRAGLSLASTVATTWKFTALRSGRFGAIGMRDPTLMTNRDGTVYVESGKAFFTASTNIVAGSGAATHQTVHSMDLTTGAIETCGQFYVLRSGVFSGDINLHIVDNGDGTQELFWATWGTAPFSGGKLEVVHVTFTGDAHLGAHVFSSWTALVLPIPAGAHAGAYDPMFSYDGTEWTVAYSVVNDTTHFGSGFWPGMATSTDLTTWTLIASDPTAGNTYEGTKLYASAGALWELAGGPAGAGNKGRIYDDTMTFVANLAATFSGGVDTQPHPMVFNYGDYAWLVTFDNTRTDGVSFSWGKYIVQRAPRYI